MRVMLATPAKTADLRMLRWPKLMSPKLDGIRAMVMIDNGIPVVMSRKMIPLPNQHVQRLFARFEFVGLDGELIVGDPTTKGVYNRTESAVMSIAGEPDVTMHVFDKYSKAAYIQRALAAKSIATTYPGLAWIPQTVVRSYEEMSAAEESYLTMGYEGGMLRCPNAPYKEGRSTLKQEWLVKVKRFTDSDAVVIGVTELQRNENDAFLDAQGYTKRSHAKAGKVAAGMLGKLIVRCVDTNDPFHGVEFGIGTGFTTEQRENLWAGRTYLPGKLVSYKYFPIGGKDRPRHPIFLRWRDERV